MTTEKQKEEDKQVKIVKDAVEVGYKAAQTNKDLEKVLERIEETGVEHE